MSEKNLTLMIVPDAHAQVKRIQIRRSLVYGTCLAVLTFLGVVGAMAVHYVWIIDEVFEADTLRQQNVALKARLNEVEGRFDNLEARLAQVKKYDDKLRQMTELNDSGRELALGPVRLTKGAGGSGPGGDDPFAVPMTGETSEAREIESALLDSRLYGMATAANRQLASLSELVDYFSAREALLAQTPSVWPARGWVTSTFGSRDDPFTGDRIFHAGIDIGARHGAQVIAPAGGNVIYAGPRGAYGNMIAIDHGRGIITHYGHLDRLLVKVGDEVERGQHIGAVGNTGRSTGPHLHYEIRVDGVPFNPRRYILE